MSALLPSSASALRQSALELLDALEAELHEMREEIRTLEQQRDRYAGLLQLAASELRSEGRLATAAVLEAALMPHSRPAWSGE